MGAECFGRPSSLAAVASNQSWGGLCGGRCKVEGFPWHSWPIHVWIFENGVEFGAKVFACLPAIRPLLRLKSQGAFVKEGWGRKPRAQATSWYQAGGQALSSGGWGGSITRHCWRDFWSRVSDFK